MSEGRIISKENNRTFDTKTLVPILEVELRTQNSTNPDLTKLPGP